MSIIHRTSDSNNKRLKLKYFTERIAVASLVFAVITYLISYFSKQNYYDIERANLNIELNNIYYFSVIADLKNYERELKKIEKHISDGMPILAYETPILDYLFSSGDIIKVFDNYSTIEKLRMIKLRLKVRENISVPSISGKKNMKSYLKDQTIQYYNLINEIDKSEESIYLYHNNSDLSDNKELRNIYGSNNQYKYFVDREIFAQTILLFRLPEIKTYPVKRYIIENDSSKFSVNTNDSVR